MTHIKSRLPAKAYLTEQVWHHAVIEDGTFWALANAVSVGPRGSATVPAREVIPGWHQQNRKWDTHTDRQTHTYEWTLPYFEQDVFGSWVIQLKRVAGWKPQAISLTEQSEQIAVQRRYIWVGTKAKQNHRITFWGFRYDARGRSGVATSWRSSRRSRRARCFNCQHWWAEGHPISDWNVTLLFITKHRNHSDAMQV